MPSSPGGQRRFPPRSDIADDGPVEVDAAAGAWRVDRHVRVGLAGPAGRTFDRLEAIPCRAVAQEPAQDLGGAGHVRRVAEVQAGRDPRGAGERPPVVRGVLVGRDERDPAPVTGELPGADVVEPCAEPVVVRARQADEVGGEDIGPELPAKRQDRVLCADPFRADDAHELRACPVPIDRVGGPGEDQRRGQGDHPMPAVLVAQVGDAGRLVRPGDERVPRWPFHRPRHEIGLRHEQVVAGGSRGWRQRSRTRLDGWARGDRRLPRAGWPIRRARCRIGRSTTGRQPHRGDDDTEDHGHDRQPPREPPATWRGLGRPARRGRTAGLGRTRRGAIGPGTRGRGDPDRRAVVGHVRDSLRGIGAGLLARTAGVTTAPSRDDCRPRPWPHRRGDSGGPTVHTSRLRSRRGWSPPVLTAGVTDSVPSPPAVLQGRSTIRSSRATAASR